jgi:nucleotide-binding universal stress UspA family protein
VIRLNNILVPVDFSDPSKRAVSYGLALARLFQAELSLAHVVPLLPFAQYPFTAEPFNIEETDLDRAKAEMASLIPPEYLKGVQFETIARTGDIQHELAAIIQERAIDMVVMGTHGRRAFERFVLGSVTERMLRKIPVPILTVSHLDPTHTVPMHEPVPLRRIVYATHLPEESTARLHFAAELARGVGASLSVVHVIEPPVPLYLSAEMVTVPPIDRNSIRRSAYEQLHSLIAGEMDGTLSIIEVLREGVPSKEIIRYAVDSKADLIVLNLQELGRLERAVLGSTAEHVIRAATIPVLGLPELPNYASHRLGIAPNRTRQLA